MSDRKVFISHPGTDARWVEAFAKSLLDRGVDVWVESKIQPGDDWRKAVREIEKAFRESELLVTLVDGEAINRPDFNFELGAALGMGKRIVSVVPPDFDESKLPQPLRQRQQLVKETPEATAEELLARAA